MSNANLGFQSVPSQLSFPSETPFCIGHRRRRCHRKTPPWIRTGEILCSNFVSMPGNGVFFSLEESLFRTSTPRSSNGNKKSTSYIALIAGTEKRPTEEAFRRFFGLSETRTEPEKGFRGRFLSPSQVSPFDRVEASFLKWRKKHRAEWLSLRCFRN